MMFISQCTLSNPSIEKVIDKILEKNPDEIIILPLFLIMLRLQQVRFIRRYQDSLKKMVPNIKFINQFYDNDKFIDAWVDKASKFDIKSYDKIVFSYHGS